MERFERLRRWVAPGLRALTGLFRRGVGAARRPGSYGDAAGRSALGEVVRLAWPIAAAMLGETAMGLVDTRLVGALGASALGGVGMAVVLMYLAYSVLFGLMRGVKVRTAHAVGRGSQESAVYYALAGVLCGAAVGVAVAVAARDATAVLGFLRVDPSLVVPARDFLAARTLGAPAAFTVSALVQYRQGLGDARTPMRAGLAANVVNGLLAWALIHGHWGMPALGVRGAGYATAVAETLEAFALLAQLARSVRAAPRPIEGYRRAVTAAAREVAGLGVPTGLQFGAETLAFTLFTVILGSMGASEVAAHQVALATIRTSFLPGLAVSEAASVLVGRALGRGRLDEADRVTRAALGVAMGFMALCGVVFAVAGGVITAAFSPDPEVVRVGRRLLQVAAVFQLLDAMNIVLRGALRGAKDVRAVAAIGVVTVWTCVPGAAWLLGRHLGMGAVGGWLGFVAETTTGAALCWWRWRRGAWRQAYAHGPGPVAAGTGGVSDGRTGERALAVG